MYGGHGTKGPDGNGTGGPPGAGGGAVADGGGARWPGVLFEAAPFVAGLVVTVALFLATRDELGDRIATHFSGGGTADDWAATSSYPWVCLALFGGLALLFGLGTALPGAGLSARSAWTATGWGTAGLLGYLLSAVLVVNADADGRDARLSWVQLVAGLGAALLAAAAGTLLRRLLPSARGGPKGGPLPGTPERLTLRPGERAGWSAHNTSAVLTGLGAVMFLLGMGLLAAGLVGVGLPLLLAGLLTFALSAVRVTVDRHGLTVAAGYLPWPRTRIGLDQVATARAQHVRALEWGGWGYRVSARGTGVILHSGEALVVRREDGRDFAVTTRDARTAAALLNTLAAGGDGSSSRPGGG